MPDAEASPQSWGLLLLFTDSKSDKVNVLKFPQFPRFQALNWWFVGFFGVLCIASLFETLEIQHFNIFIIISCENWHTFYIHFKASQMIRFIFPNFPPTWPHISAWPTSKFNFEPLSPLFPYSIDPLKYANGDLGRICKMASSHWRVKPSLALVWNWRGGFLVESKGHSIFFDEGFLGSFRKVVGAKLCESFVSRE